MTSTTPRSTPGRRRLLTLAGLIGIVGVAASAWLVGSRVQSPEQAAARAGAPTPSLVTAPVELRVLSSTVITRAEVVPAAATSVQAPTLDVQGQANSGIVTAVFVERGDNVGPGERVIEVAGRPVFAFTGATPAYRAMRPGMTGADIVQLQAGLVAVGCQAGASGVYDDATKACVENLFADAGYVAMRSSDTEAADLVAARSAVTDAENELVLAQNTLRLAEQPPPASEIASAQSAVSAAQRLHDRAVRDQPKLISDATQTTADAVASTLDSLRAAEDTLAGLQADPNSSAGLLSSAQAAVDNARRLHDAAVRNQPTLIEAAKQDAAENIASTGDALAAANASLATAQAAADTSTQQLAVDQQQATLDRTHQTLTDLLAVSGPVVPLGEIVFVPEMPARVDSVIAVVGGPASNGDLSRGTGALLVLASPALQARVSIPQPSRAFVQEGTPVELLYEATGEQIPGTVRSIDDELTMGGTGGVPSYPAVVEADLPDSWSGLNVRATFTAASTDRDVLVVPSAAVSSAADGQTRVQVERADGSIDTVPVTTGLSADGFIEVTATQANQLTKGDRVVIG